MVAPRAIHGNALTFNVSLRHRLASNKAIRYGFGAHKAPLHFFLGVPTVCDTLYSQMNAKVLVVDDEPIIADTLTIIIQRQRVSS